MLTTERTEEVDRELGNKEGFEGGLDYKTPARGVATHIYAAFEPSLKGLYFSLYFLTSPSKVS